MLNNKQSELLYKQYYPIIRNYYTSKRIDYNLSKELTHDCLTKILLNPNKFLSLQNEDVKKYLFKTAKNKLLQYKKNKHNQLNKIDVYENTEFKIENQKEINEDYIELKKFLKNNFNSDDFLIIDLYFFQNYKPSELSKLLNLETKKIKNKVDYLRKKIKGLLS